MSNIMERDKQHVKTLLIGCLLILLTNLIYIGNNYLVSWAELGAPEVVLVRGAMQIGVFGVFVWRSRKAGTEVTGTRYGRLGLYMWLFLYGFAISTASFAFLAAIPMAPIGDLIVIAFTAPVFCVFLDRIVNKRLLTILSISLCLLILLGEVFVIQPPFIFPEEDAPQNNTQVFITEDEKRGPNYYFAVVLCLYTGFITSTGKVVAAKCNDLGVSTSKLMFVNGCFSVLLSLFSTVFLPNRVLTNPSSLTTKAAAFLPLSGSITMVAYWTFTVAISITGNPTLIAVLRSTEIVISLVTESIWWGQVPGTLSLVGALIVFFSVMCMAVHDQIMGFIRQMVWSRKESVDNRSSLQ